MAWTKVFWSPPLPFPTLDLQCLSWTSAVIPFFFHSSMSSLGWPLQALNLPLETVPPFKTFKWFLRTFESLLPTVVADVHFTHIPCRTPKFPHWSGTSVNWKMRSRCWRPVVSWIWTTEMRGSSKLTFTRTTPNSWRARLEFSPHPRQRSVKTVSSFSLQQTKGAV